MKCGIVEVLFLAQRTDPIFPRSISSDFSDYATPPQKPLLCRVGCGGWEMHLKLSQNQFLEVAAADFLPHGFDKRRRRRFFSAARAVVYAVICS